MKLSNDELPNSQNVQTALSSDLFGQPKLDNHEVKELQSDELSTKKQVNNEFQEAASKKEETYAVKKLQNPHSSEIDTKIDKGEEK